jgi:hypothetical protein
VRDGVENRDKVAEFLRDAGPSDAYTIAMGTGVYVDDVEAIVRSYRNFKQSGQNDLGEETWRLA